MNRMVGFFRSVSAGLALLVMTQMAPAFADGTAPAKVADAAPAASASGDGWYFGASAGLSMPSGLPNRNFAVTVPGATFNVSQGYNLSSGLSAAGQLGYQVKNIRLEGEFLYQNFSRNATTVSVTPLVGNSDSRSYGGSQLETYSGFFNGYYDFNRNAKFSPYVGAGIGWTYLNASPSTPNANFTIQTPGVSTTVFAYQAKAGVSYNINPKTALFLQYRYTGSGGFGYGSARVNTGGNFVNIPTISNSLSNSSIELGGRFRF